MTERVGRYRVERLLGEGGMGVVYAARDDQLGRTVAIKVIRPGGGEQARRRFWREARAAASVNHPNVCQIYEVGEHEGAPFLAMELLEGEPLSARIARGALPLGEAVSVALGMLAALEALHACDVVHRDLKPSNVFLTPHGVKLLDFGLALPSATADESAATNTAITRPGTVMGTPRYMSPEQLRGLHVDARTDLFAMAAVLFEMLIGRTPFAGRTSEEVFHSTCHEQPPALTGSAAIAAVDVVIRRNLAKKPADRHPSATAMAADLRAAAPTPATAAPARAVAVSRLIALPFRILRPDPETDFLAFSLPDAVTASLSGMETLVVRSSLAASRFAADHADLERIAAEAEVDVVLTGTILRAGDALRVVTQLVEAPSGTLLWTQSSQVGLGDLFRLEDELVHRIVASVAAPLTAREHHLLRRDVPKSAAAYEYYLRGNQVALTMGIGAPDSARLARDLYLRAVEEDAEYAPAWARLGRAHRVLGKSGEAPEDNRVRAERCFQRALELNPDLPVAHALYAMLECDLGKGRDAMVRLLERARRGTADPELLAGLVHACRYSGLLEASVAAHEQARRLDPQIMTTAHHTYWLMGEYDRAQRGIGPYFDALVLISLDRPQEALSRLCERESLLRQEVMRTFVVSLRALLEGRREESVAATEATLRSVEDPEWAFYMGRQLARLGEGDRAVEVLSRTAEQGYLSPYVLARDPWLEPLRGRDDFAAVALLSAERHRAAVAAFNAAGGPELLRAGTDR